MLICTTRYYTGRSTISASVWADDLARHWASLPEGARIVIKRDLENAFERDNTSRQNREKYHALGDDCDRVMWEKVRALWAGEQPPAQPCEPTPAELACRMKWLAAEMDAVGSAMLRQAKSTGDAELRSAGWDLHDAAGALLASIEDKK